VTAAAFYKNGKCMNSLCLLWAKRGWKIHFYWESSDFRAREIRTVGESTAVRTDRVKELINLIY